MEKRYAGTFSPQCWMGLRWPRPSRCPWAKPRCRQVEESLAIFLTINKGWTFLTRLPLNDQAGLTAYWLAPNTSRMVAQTHDTAERTLAFLMAIRKS